MAGPVQCPKCGSNVPGGSRFCQACGTAVTDRPVKGGKAGKRAGAPSQWMTFVAGALIIILVGGLAMFGINRSKMAKQHPTADTTASATAQTHIDGAGPMPAWLVQADKSVIADYTWAASHHDELQYFPCFCGCDKSAGHASNSSCYFKRDAAGQITAYDQHSYG